MTDRSRRRRDRLVVTASFFLVGIVAVMLGPAIPEMQAEWDVSRRQAGWLFVAQFAGSSLGAVVSSLHLRRSLILGYGLVAASLAALALAGWRLAVPAMGGVGVGLGLVIAGSNLWTARRDPGRRAAVLATLNLVWGVGAVSSPLLFAAALGGVALETILAALALAAALAGIALALVLDDRVDAAAREPATTAGGSAPLLLQLVLAAVFFVYVGVENAVGGWLVALADDLAGGQTVVSLLIGSGFWGALLLGRGVAPWLLGRMAERRLYSACLALSFAGSLLLVLAEARPLVAAGAVATGLGLAPLFPLSVAVLVAATAGDQSRRNGWILACGGLGGAALPWLTGRVADWSGGLRYGFCVPLLGLSLLSALHVARRGMRA